ncbi:MAG: maleylpyruvate isomerase N-terminal domain-containing protein [Candidatus Dormibacteraeota bacterium]|nr:maleylpyruvate isomerase N-terminal domain-containing protein [Candidatus Dormibacteraeota bacterium]
MGAWSIRDLVGHTSRSLLTVEAYLARGAQSIEVPDAVAYFHAALGSTVDEAAVTERGRQAGAALGDDPAGAVGEIAARVVPVVERSSDDAVVGTPWGGMRLLDYLPTRSFELSIHTLDLAATLNLPGALPEPAAALTWELIAQLARGAGAENQVLRALTGRTTLASEYSVLTPPRSGPAA